MTETIQSASFKRFAASVLRAAEDALRNPAPSKFGHDYGKYVKKVEDFTDKTWLEGNRVFAGGTTGGSCYGGTSDMAVAGDNEPLDIFALDAVLELVRPDIKHLEYRKLMAKLDIQPHQSGDTDYYGNTSNYIQNRLKVVDLYEALVELGWLEDISE